MNDVFKNLREKAGLTQQQLAELAGTSQPQIMRLERGQRKMTKQWAEKLAPFLQTSAARLIFNLPATAALFSEMEAVAEKRLTQGGDAPFLSAETINAGKVEVGAFRPVDLNLGRQLRQIPVGEALKLQNIPLLRFDVEDDRMRALFPRPIRKGDIVLCLDFAYIRHVRLKDGMVVVIARSYPDSDLSELSLKQVEVHPEGYQFWQRADDHDDVPVLAPFKDGDLADQGITILGIVSKVLFGIM